MTLTFDLYVGGGGILSEFYSQFFHVLICQVNFIWINRDQKSFEWFVGLLNKIEKEQIDVSFEEGRVLEKVIDIELYMTAAKAKTDIRGAGLQMALSIIHRRDKKDLITGLSTRTQAGRPNWNEVRLYIDAFICYHYPFSV